MVMATSKATSSEMTEMAALTGYDDGTVTNTVVADALPEGAEVTSTEGNSEESTETTALLDPEDLVVDDASPRRIWNSPWSKLIFVGLVLGIGAFAVSFTVFGFQSQWTNRQKDPMAKAIAPVEQSPPDPAIQMQDEAGDLKTKAALSRQATALDQTTDLVTTAPGTTAGGTTPGVATPSATTRTPGTSTGPSTASGPIQYSAPPVSRSVPSYSAPPVSRTAPQYPAPTAASSPARAFPSPNEPLLDPYEQWQSASTLGSYGEVSYNQPSSNSAQVAAPADTGSSNPARDTIFDKSSSDYQQSLYLADEAAILSGSPSQRTTITAGTTAAATLRTPIVWDLDQDQQPQRFGLQLTQPLLAADGSEALPAAAQMIAKVDTVSDSGLVQLSVQAVIVPTASGNQLVNIPIGVISIQGDGGNPLLAENYHNNGGRLGQLNTQVAIIGALGKIGELLNRPSDTNTVSSPYISSTSVSNGQTNIIGGLLEGGFGALQQQVTQRDQEEIEDILSRPNVWYVPAGQPLQVFINSSFEVVAP